MKRFLILLFFAILTGYLLSLLFSKTAKVAQPKTHPETNASQKKAISSIAPPFPPKIKKKSLKITKEKTINLAALNPCELIKYIKYNKINYLPYLEDKNFSFYKNLPKNGYEIKSDSELMQMRTLINNLAGNDIPLLLLDIHENFGKYFPAPSQFKEQLHSYLNDLTNKTLESYPFDSAILSLGEDIAKDNDYLFKLKDLPRWFPSSLMDYRSTFTQSTMSVIKSSKDTTQMILAINFIKEMKRPDYNLFLNLSSHTRPDISEKILPIINQLAKDIFKAQSTIKFLPLLDYQGLELVVAAAQNPKLAQDNKEFLSEIFTNFPIDSKACDDRNYINMCNDHCSR